MSVTTSLVNFMNNYLPSPVARAVNRIATNRLSNSTNPRPNTYSLWSPLGAAETPSQYLSWHSVTDKKYFGLHTRPVDDAYTRSLPSNEKTDDFPFGEITHLFARDNNFTEGRSSVFFMFFAQWFTDGFFRSDFHDDRKTTTNHNIDLAQIYGRDEAVALLLRSKQGGKLTSQQINGEEYPDSLGEINAEGKWQVKEKYLELPYIQDVDVRKKVIDVVAEEKKINLYATGLERGNSILGNICFSTLFLREHNHICDELVEAYPSWDDDRLFHTARIINTVILMKLVIEDYVNHIAGLKVLLMDPSFAEKQDWYRTPWIAAEFNLLYRWHSLIPNSLSLNDKEESLVANYGLLRTQGLDAIFAAASKQHSGNISLQNTPNFMLPTERLMVEKGREWGLPSYNDYRTLFNMDKINNFSDFTPNRALQAKLKQLYGNVDKVELTVGLFAEESKSSPITGGLLTTMVAYDAVTQIYTNPLLAKINYTKENFSPEGMDRINKTKSFQDLVDRNMHKSTKISLAAK